MAWELRVPRGDLRADRRRVFPEASPDERAATQRLRKALRSLFCSGAFSQTFRKSTQKGERLSSLPLLFTLPAKKTPVLRRGVRQIFRQTAPVQAAEGRATRLPASG